MKNNIEKTILVLLVSLSVSCVTDDLSSLNVDKKNATTADASTFFAYAQKELADNLHGVIYRATGPAVTKMWAQHITPVTYLEGATYIPEFSWAPMYQDVLKNLDESAVIINQAENGSAEDANKLAMIEILKVYAYASLVEAYGDIPYSEALDFNNSTPQFDDAETVYLDLIDRLTAAVNQLDPGSAGFGPGDLIYNGDIENWIKFGNSLKLRMGLRIIDALPQVGAQAVSEAVLNVISSNAENAVFEYLPDYPNTSPWWNFLVRQGLEYYVGTDTFINTLNEFDDPRRAVFFTPVEGEYIGGQYGVVQNYHSYSREGEFFREPDLAAIFIDYAQVEFLLAEAAERGIGGVTDPEAHYNAAIRASFEYYGIEDQVDEYLAQPSVDYSTAEGPWQRKIGIQKWIALFDQGFEAWTEYRRLDYPELSAPEVAESEIVPLRFLYPIGEQTLNGANYREAADAIGGDSYTTSLFWDVD